MRGLADELNVSPFVLFLLDFFGMLLSDQVDEGLIVRWRRPSWQRLTADRSEPWKNVVGGCQCLGYDVGFDSCGERSLFFYLHADAACLISLALHSNLALENQPYTHVDEEGKEQGFGKRNGSNSKTF